MRAAYFRDHRLSIHIRSTKTCIWRLQSLTDLCSSATRVAAWALRFTALRKGSSGSSLDIPAMIPAIASKRYGCHLWACAKLISLGLVTAGYGLIQGPSSLASETCALDLLFHNQEPLDCEIEHPNRAKLTDRDLGVTTDQFAGLWGNCTAMNNEWPCHTRVKHNWTAVAKPSSTSSAAIEFRDTKQH